MDEKNFFDTIACGESSPIQFKADFKSPNQLRSVNKFVFDMSPEISANSKLAVLGKID